MKNQYLQHILTNIPHKPGVYRMKDKDGEIIYIGKAKDLYKRVNSYFKNTQDKDIKTIKMVEHIADIEYSIASSELEALVLETNLIKSHRPKYNILMKDDKNFAYIKITTNEDYPRILVVRKVEKDGAKYFGPKTSASKIYATLNTLRRIFPYRNCNLNIQDLGPAKPDDISKKRIVKVTNATIKYPCLDFHIKRCLAPCIGKTTKEEYQKVIQKIIDFLEGKHIEIIDELKEEMMQAAKEHKFEKAAQTRDKIKSIEGIFEKQLVSSPEQKQIDVINYFIQGENAYFTIFQFKDGILIDHQNIQVKNPQNEELSEEKNNQNLLTSFIQQYYADNTNIPPEILIPHQINNHQIIEDWLRELATRKVKLVIPKIGKRDKILELALENAFSFAKQSKTKWEGESVGAREIALEKLAQLIGLPKIPKRMECYDISHIGGTNTVASMSVFINGFPKKDQYRHFKINLDLKVGSPDDFKSMEEVILRRLKYLKPTIGLKDYKIIKTKENYNISYKKEKISEFKTISENKLKTFLGEIKLSEDHFNTIIQKIIEKFNTKRIYIPIKKTKLHQYELLGFQKVKIDIDEYKNYSKNIIVVFDKTRNFEDNSFKQTPDLIIIDGGKGQLSYAIKAMKDHNLEIPIMSIAEKKEEFFLPGKSSSIQLEKEDPIRLMIQHIRDEAHRFAIEYNRKLRQKDNFQSELEQIPDIGKKLTSKLLREFGSLSNLKNLPIEIIAKKVGTKTALKIKSFFQN